MSAKGDGNEPELPSRRVMVRLARLEEKQDAQIEKLDLIAEQLDGELSSVSEEVKSIRPKHNRLWIVYQGGKWVVGGLLAGGISFEVLKIVLFS